MSSDDLMKVEGIAGLEKLRTEHPDDSVRLAARLGLELIRELGGSGVAVCKFLRKVGEASGFPKDSGHPENSTEMINHVTALVADAKRYRAMFDEHGLDYFDRAIGLPKAEADAFIDNAIAEEEKKGVVV